MGQRGPLPKPDSERRRRNAVPASLLLPAAGRPGPAPEWPIGVTTRKPSGTSSLHAIWEDLWRRPQAVAWERLGLDLTVARYARMLQMSMRSADVTKKFASEVRQLEDRLGLNGPAMQRLRWEIVTSESPADQGPEPGTVTSLSDYRTQFGS